MRKDKKKLNEHVLNKLIKRGHIYTLKSMSASFDFLSTETSLEDVIPQQPIIDKSANCFK